MRCANSETDVADRKYREVECFVCECGDLNHIAVKETLCFGENDIEDTGINPAIKIEVNNEKRVPVYAVECYITIQYPVYVKYVLSPGSGIEYKCEYDIIFKDKEEFERIAKYDFDLSMSDFNISDISYDDEFNSMTGHINIETLNGSLLSQLFIELG